MTAVLLHKDFIMKFVYTIISIRCEGSVSGSEEEVTDEEENDDVLFVSGHSGAMSSLNEPTSSVLQKRRGKEPNTSAHTVGSTPATPVIQSVSAGVNDDVGVLSPWDSR